MMTNQPQLKDQYNDNDYHNDSEDDSHNETLLTKILKDMELQENLHLDKKGIQTQDAIEIASVLMYNEKVKQLELGQNMFDSKATFSLAKAIGLNKTLEAVSFYWNNIDCKCATALGKALQQNMTLRVLDLSENDIGDYGAQSVAVGLKDNSSLQELNLKFNGIGDYGTQAIAKALQVNTCLQTLNLELNDIGPIGAQALGEALLNHDTKNSKLAKINLESNKITCEGAYAFAKVLSANKSSLQILILNRCNIDNSGTIAIAKALKHNSTLKELYMNCNVFHDSSATMKDDDKVTDNFAMALETNKCLEILDIEWNDIDEAGTKALAQRLFTNSTLKQMRMKKSKIGYETEKAMNMAHFYTQDIHHVARGIVKKHDYNELVNNLNFHKLSDHETKNMKTTFWGWKATSRLVDERNRLPLHHAAETGLKWKEGAQQILQANYAALSVIDDETGLCPFMLAGAGPKSDLNVVYELLQCNPGVMNWW